MLDLMTVYTILVPGLVRIAHRVAWVVVVLFLSLAERR